MSDKQTEIVFAEKDIRRKIYTIRGMQVMLDRDLASLYQVETRILNQAVKRNKDRFPKDFTFQLTQQEYDSLRSQFVILEDTGKGRHSKYSPSVFTEQGVAMLAAVLKSDVAAKISVQIARAFVQMRRLIADNALLIQRMDHLERKQLITDTKLEKVLLAIEDRQEPPQKGIFFDGQVFDAYVFVCKLIKKAKKSIVLIDNYIDESVLMLLSKRSKNCSVTIYTKNLSEKLKLDLNKYNAQYPKIDIKEFSRAHDRFLMIDGHETYHIGASLKDLGKKWFAFSKFETESLDILKELKK